MIFEDMVCRSAMSEFYGDLNSNVDPLGLSEDQMRRLAHMTVDMVLDRWSGRTDQPVVSTLSPEHLSSLLGGPVPDSPRDAVACLHLLAESALKHQQHGDHPRYFARVPGPASFVGVLGEWLATGFNSMAASWQGASGPTTIELTVIGWLADLLGLPDDTEGILVSGGSMANMTALGVARHVNGPGPVYCTDQTHSSIRRSLIALGVDSDLIRVLPTDEQFRLPVELLAQSIQSDLADGHQPCAVVATAGTTNTGAIDPLKSISDLCRKYDVWMHVDGAYGAPAAMVSSTKQLFDGIHLTDSVAVDPHKWLFQPYDIGCCLITRPDALENTYSMNPEYLRDVQGQRQEVDMRNRSLELSRRSRGVKLWLTFQIYGADRIRQGIQRGIELAEFVEAELHRTPEVWQVVTPAQLGIITFARVGASKRDHQEAVRLLAEDGYAAVSSTEVKGRSVLRLCTINPLTTEGDIRGTLTRLAALTDSSAERPADSSSANESPVPAS